MDLNKISTLCLLTWVALSFLASTTTAQNQPFDYPSHPKLDFTFNHLELELNINPGQQILEGHAAYQLEANIGGVDSLVLNAAHMDIREVQVGGSEAPYRLGNDSLFVALGETSEAGKSYTVDIMYETSPRFGVHSVSGGTVWSSLLPLSTRHWLPVADHPRVAFTTDIALSFPATSSSAAPGRKSADQVTSVDRKQVRFQSARPIPASALWFAIGSFRQVETSFGVKQIRVMGDAQMMDRSGKELLEKTYSLLDETEQRLGTEYPFETLNVILLDDHRWETKPYGAGGIFLFANRGSLEAQLRRGIYAQWFGVLQREEQWSDAEAITLYQTVLNQNQPADSTTLLKDAANPEASVNPYHAFSPKRWNGWQRFYPAWQDSGWKQIVEQSLTSELANGSGVKHWEDFAEHWYETSGQPWFSPPELVVPQRSAQQDSIVYQVDYNYDEASGELVLNFQAQDSIVTELVTLPLIQHSSQKTDTLEVTFTGQSESVMYKLDPLISYVSIDALARENLYLRERKPVPFILNQLRDTGSEEAKAAAAQQLGNYTDNPDLQLAITDMLSQDQPPKVQAALLQSMGEITQGASGTEQQFLDALRSENIVVKKAAASALRYYHGNSQVQQSLQQLAIQSDTISLFKQATNSFLATVDSSNSAQLSQFAQRVMNQDSTGNRAVFALQQLADHEHADIEELTSNMSILIGKNYPYPVREQALNLLTELDTDESRWTTRVNSLLDDTDPRMRFLAVQSIAKLDFMNARNLLKDHILDEYDARVFYEMLKLTGG